VSFGRESKSPDVLRCCAVAGGAGAQQSAAVAAVVGVAQAFGLGNSISVIGKSWHGTAVGVVPWRVRAEPGAAPDPASSSDCG
jgi:hypothetical protein